jgi:hypothetical protein
LTTLEATPESACLTRDRASATKGTETRLNPRAAMMKAPKDVAEVAVVHAARTLGSAALSCTRRRGPVPSGVVSVRPITRIWR